MSRVLATYNIKGGVGKTSAAVNLATLAAHERRTDAAVGPRPAGREHVPVPRQPKVKGGGAKLVRGKSDVDALLKGTDTEGLDLLPADFSYRHMDLALGDAKRPSAASPACSSRSRTSTSTRSWTARRASRSCRENVFEAADALLVPIIPATLSLAHARAAAQRARAARRPAGPRLLLDGRPPQEAAPRADGRASAREHDMLETVIPNSADVERMGARARRARGLRAAQPRRARLRGPLGRGPRALEQPEARSSQVASRRRCASGSDSSFLSVWFSICRMRSRVTLNARPTSSSV